jgi:flagellar basal body-associated protein FliL
MEGALVVLALLACPVGMGLMMWFMSKGTRSGEARAEREPPASLEELRSEHARLRADIERLEDAERARDGEPAPR